MSTIHTNSDVVSDPREGPGLFVMRSHCTHWPVTHEDACIECWHENCKEEWRLW